MKVRVTPIDEHRLTGDGSLIYSGSGEPHEGTSLAVDPSAVPPTQWCGNGALLSCMDGQSWDQRWTGFRIEVIEPEVPNA